MTVHRETRRICYDVISFTNKTHGSVVTFNIRVTIIFIFMNLFH